jgi:hypothetical protein
MIIADSGKVRLEDSIIEQQYLLFTDSYIDHHISCCENINYEYLKSMSNDYLTIQLQKLLLDYYYTTGQQNDDWMIITFSPKNSRYTIVTHITEKDVLGRLSLTPKKWVQ